jgi:hypothetical protein
VENNAIKIVAELRNIVKTDTGQRRIAVLPKTEPHKSQKAGIMKHKICFNFMSHVKLLLLFIK